VSASELRAALGALENYCAWHVGSQATLKPVREASRLVSVLRKAGVMSPLGGVERQPKEVVLWQRGRFSARHSVRVYQDAPVDASEIMAVVKAAQSAPSVCNRQGGRLHLYLEKDKAAKVLACHVGAGGFRENIPAVAVVTCDLRIFGSVKERYQGWIDGGLFLMQFLNALHAAGLGSCPLNWSVTPDRDAMLRQAGGIPAHERIIALVSFGYLPSVVTWAKSPRKEVHEVCTIH
jgi:nitroreductase